MKNIIFYFSDQQRWDTAGCYGQSLNVTPNLDKLAKDGAVFEHAYTCQPVCGPARSCLQIGKYAESIGCYRNNIALPESEKTIAEYLKAAGYEVGYVGKWHLASTGDDSNEQLEEPVDYSTRAIPLDRRGGYSDYWVASDVLEATSHGYGGYLFDKDNNKVTFDGYRTDSVTDHAIDFLSTRKADVPYFLFLSHIEPHHQNDHDCFEGPNGSKESFRNYNPPDDLKYSPGDWNKNWEAEYPDYLGCCNSLDKNLGRILDTLEKTGQKDNTIIIFTSDHGSHFRTRCVEYKRSCHESSIHVPLVIYGSELGKGIRYNELVSLIDLPPTILKMAGADVPVTMHGYPIQNILTQPDDWQEEVFFQISESQVGRGIRTQDYKYSVRAYDKDSWTDARSDIYTEEYLYDLKSDPSELQNLVHDPAYVEVRSNLKNRLVRCMIHAGEKEPQILPPLPKSTVDLGLNGIIGDYLRNEGMNPIINRHFGAIISDKDCLKSTEHLSIKNASKHYPQWFGENECDAFLKELIGFIARGNK